MNENRLGDYLCIVVPAQAGTQRLDWTGFPPARERQINVGMAKA